MQVLQTQKLQIGAAGRTYAAHDMGWEEMPASSAKYLNLNNHLPFLMNRGGNLVIQLFSRDLAPLGISVPMWRVLAVLAEKGPLRLIDLGLSTSIELSTLSRIVSGMTRKKLVTRALAKENRRQVTIAITAAGSKTLARAAPIALEYEAKMTRGLSRDDLETTKRTLNIAFEKLLEISRHKP